MNEAMKFNGLIDPIEQNEQSSQVCPKGRSESETNRPLDASCDSRRPMHTILIPNYPVLVEDCYKNTILHRASYRVSIMNSRNYYHGRACSSSSTSANEAPNAMMTKSSNPPIGRPLSGPPSLVNMLRHSDSEVTRESSLRKRSKSPKTIIYGTPKAPITTSVSRNLSRAMSADEKLFVEAAVALSHAESSARQPATKKSKKVGMPPPPFALQQRTAK